MTDPYVQPQPPDQHIDLSQPAPPVPAPRPNSGFAIASMVLGILGVGILAVIFGHLGLREIKRTGKDGRGMAIAGLVLGYISVAFWTIFWIVMIASAASVDDYEYTPPSYSDSIVTPDDRGQQAAEILLDDLHDGCAAGDMAACDALYFGAPYGSAEEAFGQTCGGREPANQDLCDR